MKSIIIYSIGIRGGGAETFLRGILPFFCRSFSETPIYVWIPESRKDYYLNLGNNVHLICVSEKILNSTIKRAFFEFIVFPRKILAQNPSVCLSASEYISPLLGLYSIPIILVYHSTLQNYAYSYPKKLVLQKYYTIITRKICARIASQIVAVSHFERAEICGLYPFLRRQKICVIYHGIEACENQKRLDSLPSPFSFQYILCVSDIYEHKKILEMLEIYSHMINSGFCSVHLVIIGRVKDQSEKKRIDTLVIANNLGKYVHFLNYIDNDEIKIYFRKALFYWTNSAQESFGLTPLEAMSLKVPVFASWGESLPELYGDSVLFYDRNLLSLEEISQLGISLISNSELRSELIGKGYAQSLKYSWAFTAMKYVKLIEKVIKKNGKSLHC